MIATEEQARAWVEDLARGEIEVMRRLDRFITILGEENGRQNLVSATSLGEVWRRHIADSAQLLRFAPPEASDGPWLDLGSGAGFPGIVVAMLRPDCEVILVESRARRVEWLERACTELSLASVRVLSGRLETLTPFPAAIISARAFAPLDRLLSLSAPFSTSATLWLLPKGRSAQHELASLRGWDHMFHVEQSLTDPESGVVVGRLSGRKSKVP